VGIQIGLCLNSNKLQSTRIQEIVQCEIKFELTENKLKPVENIQFKIKLYRRKKPRHFFYTIEYPYPPTNSAGYISHLRHRFAYTKFYFGFGLCTLDTYFVKMENADLVTAAYFKSIQGAFRFTVSKKFFYDFKFQEGIKKVKGFMLISMFIPKSSVVDPHWFQCGSGSRKPNQ
jgi:hypothetical protein